MAKKRPRYIAYFTAIFLALVVLVIVFLPTILSTPWGRDLATDYVNDGIKGRIEVKELQLRWFAPQRARDIALYDSSGQLVGRAAEINIYRSLLALIWKPTHLGQVEILSPTLTLQIDEDGVSNFQDALAPKKDEPAIQVSGAATPMSGPQGVQGTFVIRGGQATALFSDGPPTDLSGINAELTLDQARAFSLHFASLSGSGEDAGSIHLDTGLNAQFVLRSRLHHFPSSGLDAALSLISPRWARMPSALFGPYVDGQIHLHADPDTLVARSDLHASHATIEMAINTDEKGELGQDQQGKVLFSLPPHSVEALLYALSGGEEIKTSDSLTLKAELGTIAGHVKQGKVPTLSDLALDASIHMAPIQLSHSRRGGVSLRGSDARLSLKQLHEPIHLHTQIKASHAAREGNMTADVEIRNLFSKEGGFQPAEASAHGALVGSNLPLGWIGLLSGLGDTLEELIGASLSFKADLDYDEESTTLALTAKSPQLELPTTTLSLGRYTVLKEPVTLSYMLTPAAWHLLFGTQTALPLSQSAPLKIKVSELTIPPDFLPRTVGTANPGKLAARLTIPRLALENPGRGGPISLLGLEAEIEGNTLSELAVESIFSVHFDRANTLAARLAGQTIPAEVGAVVSVDPHWSLSFERFRLKTKSPSLLADFQGQYTDGVLAFVSPVSIQFIPGMTAFDGLRLAKSPIVEIAIEPFALPVDPLDLKDLHVKGTVAAEEVVFAGAKRPAIDEVSGAFEITTSKQQATFDLAVKASDVTVKQGAATAKITLQDFVQEAQLDLTKAHLKMSLDAKRIPASLFNWFKATGPLDVFVGPHLSGEVDASLTSLSPVHGEAKLALTSDLLSVNSAVTIGEVLSLSRAGTPTNVKWTITPRSLHSLRRMLLHGRLADADPGLQEPTVLALTLKELSWPIAKAQPFDPEAVKIDAQGSIEAAKFEAAELQDLNVSVRADNLTRPWDLSLGGKLVSAGASQRTGSFALEGSIANFLDSQREWSIAHLGSDLTLTLDQMPIAWLAQLAGLSPKAVSDAQAVLGRSLDLRASAKLDRLYGPVSLQMQSPLTQLHLEGLIQDRAITLTKPAYAQLAVTPAAGQVLLEGVNPILASSVRSERPVTLTIDSEGFRIPIQPFKLERVQVGKGVIAPGRIWIAHKGIVKKLLSFFGAHKVKTDREILAWCTPLYFSIKDGIASYARMDMLLGKSLQIASWGSVNLLSDQMRLTFAIPGTSLKELLKIPALPDQYYLLIPVKGTVQDPRINDNKLSARIAAILAKKQGIQGEIVGSMIDILSGSKSGQRRVPPPTTQPFPWD